MCRRGNRFLHFDNRIRIDTDVQLSENLMNLLQHINKMPRN
jgi:hypothetical protein